MRWKVLGEKWKEHDAITISYRGIFISDTNYHFHAEEIPRTLRNMLPCSQTPQLLAVMSHLKPLNKDTPSLRFVFNIILSSVHSIYERRPLVNTCKFLLKFCMYLLSLYVACVFH